MGYISERLKNYLREGSCQKHQNAPVLHINFDADIDVGRVENIFGRENRVLAFATISASVALKFNLVQYHFDEI